MNNPHHISFLQGNTLGKDERICSKWLIAKLFKGNGSWVMTAFPVRLVALVHAKGEPLKFKGAPIQVLVSVPKRCFKRAVKRNRAKRQLREAFRKNKHVLAPMLEPHTDWQAVSVALIWTDDRPHTSAEVESKVTKLLQRLNEKALATASPAVTGALGSTATPAQTAEHNGEERP